MEPDEVTDSSKVGHETSNINIGRNLENYQVNVEVRLTRHSHGLEEDN